MEIKYSDCFTLYSAEYYNKVNPLLKLALEEQENKIKVLELIYKEKQLELLNLTIGFQISEKIAWNKLEDDIKLIRQTSPISS